MIDNILGFLIVILVAIILYTVFEYVYERSAEMIELKKNAVKGRSLIARKIAKQEFIKKYRSDCKKAFKYGIGHKDYKTKEGRALVDKARTELNFKDTSYSGDIYFGLCREYFELFKLKF